MLNVTAYTHSLGFPIVGNFLSHLACQFQTRQFKGGVGYEIIGVKNTKYLMGLMWYLSPLFS